MNKLQQSILLNLSRHTQYESKSRLLSEKYSYFTRSKHGSRKTAWSKFKTNLNWSTSKAKENFSEPILSNICKTNTGVLICKKWMGYLIVWIGIMMVPLQSTNKCYIERNFAASIWKDKRTSIQKQPICTLWDKGCKRLAISSTRQKNWYIHSNVETGILCHCVDRKHFYKVRSQTGRWVRYDESISRIWGP